MCASENVSPAFPMPPEGSIREITVSSVAEMLAFGRTLGAGAQAGDCIVLCGDLGAGKTHLTKGIATGLGIAASITSPTFNLVAIYDEGRLPLYHFDLYRLERVDELEDIGFYETLEQGGLSVIEWGDRFPKALPSQYLRVSIALLEGTNRLLTLEQVGE